MNEVRDEEYYEELDNWIYDTIDILRMKGFDDVDIIVGFRSAAQAIQDREYG